jgi:hypothetical protein
MICGPDTRSDLRHWAVPDGVIATASKIGSLHHCIEDLRPNPIKPHPQEPVCGEEPKPTGVLAPQDAHLLSKGNELKFKAGAATNTKR